MKVVSVGQTDVGLIRKLNQDVFGIFPESDLNIVADGMGGRPAGEVASKVAVEAIRDFFSNPTETPDLSSIHAAILHANKKVLDAAEGESSRRGMGTTVVVLLARPTEVLIGFLGDSRAYLHRAGTLTQLTQDHSLVNEYIKLGILTPEAARVHPFRHVISRGIGVGAEVAPETLKQSAQAGDCFLLCTDGLSNLINHGQINAILTETKGNLSLAASTLIESAKKAGGKDNITVVLVGYEE